jgi:hypothetical protein
MTFDEILKATLQLNRSEKRVLIDFLLDELDKPDEVIPTKAEMRPFPHLPTVEEAVQSILARLYADKDKDAKSQ